MSELYISVGFLVAIIADAMGYKSDAIVILMFVIVVELKLLIEEVKNR